MRIVIKEVVERSKNKTAGFIAAAMAIAFPLVTAGNAEAVDAHGRLAWGYVNMNQNESQAQDITVSNAKLRMKIDHLGWDNVKVNIDSRVRGTSNSNYYVPDSPQTRLDALNLEIDKAFGFMDVIIGRQLIGASTGTKLDGANFRAHLVGSSGLGFYLGQEADPYKDSVSSNYKAYGAYFFSQIHHGYVMLGYNMTTYKNKADRDYLNFNGYYTPSDWLSVSANFVQDKKAEGGSEVTLLNLSGTIHRGKDYVLSGYYQQFSPEIYRESMVFGHSWGRQSILAIHGDVRIAGPLFAFGRFDTRSRQVDSKTGSLINFGLKLEEIFHLFDIEAGYTTFKPFTAKVDWYEIKLDYHIGETGKLRLETALLTNKQDDLEHKMNQLTYGLAGEFEPFKNVFMVAEYRLSQDKYQGVANYFSQVVSDKITTNTVFVQFSYRF